METKGEKKKGAAPGVVGLELKDGSDFTCVRCKVQVPVGCIVCPACADDLGKRLRTGVDE